MRADGIDTFDRLVTGYDRGMSTLEHLWLRELRACLLPYTTGNVLEVGVGTGVNFQYYPESVRVTAIDESSDMLLVAAGRAASQGCACHLSRVNAERLAFRSGQFDTIVATLVLCSVVDQQGTLGEMRRVVSRPGGTLLLIEHMRPKHPLFGGLVDVLNIPWLALNGRCNVNRETQQAVTQAGFHLERVETRLGGLLRMMVAQAL